MALILSVSLCACVEFGAKLESISLSETNITLTVGDSRSLSVTTQPEGMDAGPLTWTSVNPAIARVENGTVIAASAGTTVVTATTEDGKSAAAQGAGKGHCHSNHFRSGRPADAQAHL